MALIGNRYEILSHIDSIELNILYKARDVYENNKVYIKIIEHSEKIKNDFISNLIDESTALENIKSGYIMKILEVGTHCTEDSVFYYIVSEYSSGIGLDKIISGNYLHLEAIISMATQILKALEIAHDHNLYHGSLNPKNIIVDKLYNIKVCDFGVTKANHGVNIRANGEISYLSPHQLNIDYTDKETDFYALGLILFECIFKKLPYKVNLTEIEMLKSIDRGINWVDIKAINGNDELIRIIKKLLSRNDKYTNTQDIIIDLSKIMYEKADIKEDEEEKTNLDEICIDKDSNNKSKKLLLGSVVIAIISMLVINYL